MKEERKLELNFDDPVEYLTAPTYLGATARRLVSRAPKPVAADVEIQVTVKTVMAGSRIAGKEGA